jgi:hypothetical protein
VVERARDLLVDPRCGGEVVLQPRQRGHAEARARHLHPEGVVVRHKSALVEQEVLTAVPALHQVDDDGGVWVGDVHRGKGPVVERRVNPAAFTLSSAL